MNPISKATVFTDGSSRGNPGPGGWGAIVSIAGGETVELGGASTLTTNNEMELMGVLQSLAHLQKIGFTGEIEIFSDSKYVIQGATEWLSGWQKRGWKKADGEPIANQQHFERLAELLKHVAREIQWHHVRGHRGIPGNERVDRIATDFALGRAVELFCGPTRDYPVSLFVKVKDQRTQKKDKGDSAVFYVSSIGGAVETHTSWSECERRVKGKSGAKYQKVHSEGEFQEVLKKWGVRS